MLLAFFIIQPMVVLSGFAFPIQNMPEAVQWLTWLDPLRALDPEGDPVAELLGYVRRKLELSRDFPRESRLFANEMLQGAPRIRAALEGELRDLVEEKSAVLRRWMDQGRIAPVHPVHLIFAVWALTQHYADFDVQVRAVLGPDGTDPFPEAGQFLEVLFRRLLEPGPGLPTVGHQAAH
jgi:TetR/AcrR family transcriptional regulator